MCKSIGLFLNQKNIMSGTKIVKCNCNNDFQDREYGKNNRVANGTGKSGTKDMKYRCTICLKIH